MHQGPDPRETSALLGRQLGEFVVREPLSSGGFGTVFRAEQPTLAREAVIKVLHTRLRASDTVIQRFLREARLASRLDHPYAAHIYAFGAEPDGLLWIAMELVRGTPLDKLLEAQGPIPLERFAPLLVRLCEVVQTAHEQGIVHRDIKPGNVMVLARAGQLLPKLLDLGIAKLDDDSAPPVEGRITAPPAPITGDDSLADTAAPVTTGVSDGRLTEDGAVMGSPFYMAPEQWTDAGSVDARTDIYALGVLSYEALTGKPPFAGASRMQIAMAHARQPLPRLGGDFPVALDAVLARAVAKKSADRYPSALELGAAFATASGIEEAIALPRLRDELRVSVLARAPQPLAQAVGALEAARNPHHARDAVWQIVRVAVRLVGTIALAAHSHVGAGSKMSESGITEALRRLRRRALPDAEWLALARELTAPFARLREAYPVPELLDFLAGPAAAPLADLLALRDADVGARDEQVRELLATSLPLIERVLDGLAFLDEYRLVVPDEAGAAVWMGMRRSEPQRLPLRGHALEAGQPALADATGLPVITLWPFVQCEVPSPGAPPHLFFVEGKGRRGARLVALPDSYERNDEALWEILGGLVGDTPVADGRATQEETCPFPGLSAFTAADAARFFGRERESEAFVNRLRATPLLAIVGPSGAGKSSFVQAGVVPALPEDWQVITLRPGPAPLVSLTSRLAALGFEPAMLRAELQESASGLGTLLRSRAARGTLVLVVDQLEEIFTLCEDVAERERFVEALVRAARSPDDPVRVVFTLRDDFLLRAEGLAALRSRLAPAIHLLTTPGRDDLRRILTEPLRQAGYEFDEPGLADEMVDALTGTHGALALLSFTASKLWELRDRRFRQIGRKAYASLGGVGGALARHAEATLEAMLPEEQRLVREVFRHAVTADGTRAVLSHQEIDQVLGGSPFAAGVIEKLVAARLLVASEGAGGAEQIEVTHEALIEAWPRLVGWRREDAEGARLRDQLRAAARQWDERGRPSGLLWRGDALAEYRLWRSRYPGALTDVENAFAAASQADATRATRRRTVGLAVAFTALTAGVVALLVLNARAERQRSYAEANRQLAERNESEATQNAAKLKSNLLAQYEDQGRRLLLDRNPLEALAYLAAADQLGAKGPAHELLAALALRATDAEQFRVHEDLQVQRSRFAPDGQRFVTCGSATSARIWSAADGRALGDVPLGAPVTRAEFSADSRRLVVAGRASTALVWDVTAQRALAQLDGHTREVHCASFSPDGELVVTMDDADAVRLWRAATGELVRTLHPATGTGAVLQFGAPCAFSRDGTRVAAGDTRGRLRVWTVRDGRVVADVAPHTDQINWLRFSADGRRVVTASSDATAAVWDLAGGRRLVQVHHADRVNSAELSPDERTIATASNDHTAVLWDATTGRPLRTLVGHVAGVNLAVFRRDGAQVATVSDDSTAILWDPTDGEIESRLVGHAGPITDADYAPDGHRVLTAGSDNLAIAWSTTPEQPVLRLAGHRGTVRRAEFSPDGRRVVTAGDDGTARIWDRAGRSLVVMSQPGAVVTATFAPDGATLATAGSDGVVRIWDAATGVLARTLVGHTGEVADLAWDPGGTRLASAGEDGTARVWDLATGGTLVFRGHGERRVYSVRFSPSGDVVVTTGGDNTTRIWDPRSGKERASVADADTLSSAEWDPGGTMLVSTSFQSAGKVWRPDGTLVAELHGHDAALMSAVWSPDGDFIASSSIDGTTRIWDPRRGEALAVLGDHRVQVWWASYSPDGRALVTANADGTASIWELPERGTRRLADLAACRTPFRLLDERLVTVTRPDCTSNAPR